MLCVARIAMAPVRFNPFSTPAETPSGQRGAANGLARGGVLALLRVVLLYHVGTSVAVAGLLHCYN